MTLRVFCRAARAMAAAVAVFGAVSAFAVTKTWTNNNGLGDSRWATATNWSPSGVPTSSDVVEIGVTDQTSNYCIVDTAAVASSVTLGNVFLNNPTLEVKAGATLTIGAASTTAAGTNLFLNNGNLAGAGGLTVNGTLSADGGQISGTGALTIAAGATLDFAATVNTCYLARDTTNDGSIIVAPVTYETYLYTSAVITNNGIIDLQADKNLWTSGGGPFRIDNQSGGLVQKSAGTGTSAVKCTLNNASGGFVKALTGTLQLEGGGTSAGTFDAASSTFIGIANTGYTMSSGAAVTGTGKIELTTTLTIASGADVTIPNLHLANGSAKIDGSGTLRVSSGFDWDGGSLTGGGLTRLETGGSLTLDCAASYCYLDNRQLELTSGSNALYDPTVYGLYLQNGSTFQVDSGATLNIQTDLDINNGGGAASLVSSAGTVQKTSGSGQTFVGVPFSSTGGVSATSGDLQFAAGATLTGGTLNAGTSSNIDVTGGVFSIASAVTFSGTGGFRVTGGTFRVPTGVTQAIGNLTLSGNGVIDGGGTLQLTGTATWSGGTMGSASASGGTTEVAAAATLDITCTTNYAYLDYDRQLVNNGTTNYAGVTYALYLYNSADITNNGAFDMANDSGINVGGSSPRVFTNNATLTKSGGTGATGAYMYAQFDNASTGSLAINSGRINLQSGGTSSGVFSIASGAWVQVTGTYSFGGTPSVSGSGTLRVTGELIVPGGVTLAVPQLQFDSGFISGAGTLRISGTSYWTGGTMGHSTSPGGTTEIVTGGQLYMTGANSYMYLDQNRTLLNGDLVHYTATTYGLYVYNGAQFQNNATMNYDSDLGIGNSGSGTLITNTGLIYRSTGTATVTISPPVNNDAAIQVDSGGILLSGGGTHTGGTFTANASGSLGFSGGTHALDAVSSLAGTGTIVFSGGTTSIAGSYSPAKMTISGGTVNFNANGSSGQLLFSNGTLSGTGALTISDDSTWSGGTMSGSGQTVVAALKTLTISATTNYCYLDARTLTNNGTIAYTPTGANYYLYAQNSGVLANAGTFNITADQIITSNGTGTFNNSGTLSKTGGTGTTTISLALNNTGTVSATSGILALSGSGTHTGNFTTGATLAFSGGTHTISGPGTISGTGTLAFTGATVTTTAAYAVGTLKVTAGTATFNVNGSADTLDMSGGTLSGSGTFTANNGGTWSGGTMSGTGQTVVPGSQTLALSAAASYCYLDTRTFTNNGTINYTASTYYLQIYNSAAFNNTGTFAIAGDQYVYGYNSGAFNNSGTLTKTTTSGITNVSAIFNNSGSVTVSTGTLQLSGSGTSTGTWTVNSPATLNFSGGTHSVGGASTISGTGTLALSGATLTVTIPYNVGTLNVTGGTNTFDVNGSANAFTMSGGTFGGTGTFTATNGGSWSGGTMSGTGSTIVPATQTLAISASTYCYLDTRTLANNGTITYTSPGGAYMQVYNNGTINNPGSFVITGGATLYGYANGTLNNSGTLSKTGGGQMDVALIVNNTGQITVSAGTLSLQGGGTHTNGTFTATAPGAIQFSGGTHTLSGGGSLGGTGTYLFTGGTTTIAIPYAIAALTISNGTATFNTNGTAGPFTFSNGTLNGTGTITFTDNGTWSGGTMSGTGTSIFSAGKTYTLGGVSYLTLDTRTLTNNGVMNYVAPTYYFTVSSNATLANAGTLNIQTDTLLYGTGNGTIDNTGTIARTSGTANATEIYANVNNNGTITVSQGALTFRGNGTHNGAFTATSPGAMNFTGGTHALSATSTLGGNGTYNFGGATVTVDGTWGGTPIELSSGSVTFNTNATIPSLTFTNGTLTGNGNITVTGNSTWSAGTMDGNGTTIFDTTAVVTMNGATGYTTLSRPLQNLGTINYSAPTYYLQIDSATLTNDGTFDIQTGQLLYAYGTSPAFVNNGTLKKTAGAGTMTFYPALTNTGTVQVGAATMNASGGYTQSAGSTDLLNNATLQVATLNLAGGSLTGNGTVAGNVTSSGIVGPGASPGTLTITGNYTQSATGALNIELAGTTAGTGYDQLVVTGSVTLDGALNVSAINGFLPVSGNTFQILTFGSRPGPTDFASKNGLNLGSGTDLIPAYSTTDLQLTTNTVQTDLQISMTASPATIANGSTAAYNVTVVNGGGSNASGVAFAGTLPANVTFVSAAPAICSGAPNITCTFGNIPNGGSASVAITVAANGTGTAAFTANVAGSQFDPNGANNTATASFTITANADVAVSVTSSPASVAAGQGVSYSIVVTNNGPDTANTVSLAVAPSSGLTFNSASGPCTGGFPCALGNMASGATFTINSNWTVSPTATTQQQLAASVTSASPVDPNGANNSATATTSITQQVDVSVVKTGPTSVPPEAGTTVTYTLTVGNNGPSSAPSVNLDDPTPAGLALSSVSGECSAFPCTIANVAVGASRTTQVVYTISGAVGTTFTNTATVTAAGDANATNDSSSVTTTVSNCPATSISAPASVNGSSTGNAASVTNIAGATYSWLISNGTITSGATTNAITFTAGATGSVTLSASVTSGACTSNPSASVPIVDADISVTKTGPATVSPVTASQITYTIDVVNNGPSAANSVTLSDPQPPGLTLVSATGACSALPCALGTMASGQMLSVQATYSFTSGGQTVTNTATATSPTPDRNPSNNSGSATTMISGCPTVSITGPGVLEPGASATATVTNISGATFNWSIANGTITAGQNAQSVTFTAGALGTTTLSVTVNAGQCSASATHNITVTSTQADVSISKSAPATVDAHSTFAYTLTVTNNGPANADNVTITDALPAGVTFVSASSPLCSGTSTITCALGTLGAPGMQTITLTVTAPNGPATLNNTASVTTTSADPNTLDNASSVSTAVAAAPDPCAGNGPAAALSPENDSSSGNGTVTFTWTDVAGASEYRVWMQTGTAAPEVLGSTLTTSLTRTIAAGTHTWWVETIFSGCPSHESAHLTFTILAPPSCESHARPELSQPPNGAVTTSASVAFSWSAVDGALQYELWLTSSTGVPTLVEITSLPNVTTEVPLGRVDWFVRAIFNACPFTESLPRQLTYEPLADCTGNQRPVLLAPAEGERVGSPVSFDWNDVIGATGYDLFVVDGDGAPQLVATTTLSQAPGIQRALGAGRWFVRARFAPGCASLDSTESRFVVVPQVAACSPLDAPVLSAPGQISSGAHLRVQWTFVPGATKYIIQSSSDPNFPNGVTTTDDVGGERQQSFELENDGTEPRAFYVRVRAIDTRCTPESAGPFSSTAIIYVLPAKGSDASSLIGDAADIAYHLTLEPALAGQAFSAVPTTTWISVSPTNGIVPAGGMALVVTAHTAGLPPGTSIGGVAITTGAASRIRTNGVTVTTPISVSLVSPVTPAPKNTPPPDALVIPAVANADGIGSHFQSDVRVSNTSAQAMKYQLTYTPSGEAGLAAGKQTTFSIEPGRTVALDDILKTWFGTGPTNAMGTLEIRPLTEVSNRVTFASSRTFNITPNGTFGQFIPAIAFSDFIGTSKVLSLQQIAQSAQYRTNLGLVEGSGEPANVLVKVFGADGAKITEFPVNLAAGQHTQLNAFLSEHGVSSLSDGRVEVSVTGGNGKVTAYASVLDNATADPLLVSPVSLDADGNTRWVVPGVADLSTGAANWQTDMRIFNAGTAPEELTMTFYPLGGGAPSSLNTTLAAGEVKQLNKILPGTFGISQNGGAVHITTAHAARLIATARTYNQTTQGTYGQFIPAVTPAEAVGVGSRPLQLLQVEESSRYRSNIGLAEVTGKPVTLEVTITPPDAKFSATTEVTLAANEFRQIPSLLASVGLSDTYNARISVRAVSGEGRATAYASVIDARTNDPTYVPAQ